MTCSSCHPTSSSRITCPLESSLRDFTCFLSSHVNLHSSECPEKPKTRQDLVFAHDETSTFTLPSLSMFPARNAPPSPTLIPCGSKKQNISASAVAEQTAIRNLSHPTSYSRSDVNNAPEQIARNACASFTSLIEANLRQYFKIHVLRQSQGNVCSADSAHNMAKSLFLENGRHAPIKLLEASVSFSVPASGDGARSEDNECAAHESRLNLALKIMFKMNIGGEHLSVPVEGHGSIAGVSKSQNVHSINRLDVTLDTARFLFSLREKARLVAWKVITATSTPLPLAATKTIDTVPRVQHVKSSCAVTPCSSPELAPKRKLFIKLEEHTSVSPSLRNECPSLDSNSLSASLPPKKRLCLRSTLPKGVVGSQSPLTLLTGIAVLANLKNQERK